MDRKECRLSIILLAAGDSRRFNGNKMLTMIDGIPMYRHILGKVLEVPACRRVIVTQYTEIIDYVKENMDSSQILPIRNEHSSWGIAHSLKLGINICRKSDAYLFAVCDQPWVTVDSIRRLVDAFCNSGKGIACLSHRGRTGNPVIFHEKYRDELLALEGDAGGKAVMKCHLDDLEKVEVEDPLELSDIDTREEQQAFVFGVEESPGI